MAGLLSAPSQADPSYVPPQPVAPPVDPQAGVASLLATPDEQLKAYAKTHALTAALRILGGGMSDMAQGGGSVNSDAALADLHARAAQPLQLAQQKARIAGLMQAYAGADPTMKALILSDPEKAIAALAKNQELQPLGQGQQLQNAGGATAPPVPSVLPFANEGGVILNKASGQGVGVSQPINYPASNTAGSFTPSIGGTPSQGSVAQPPPTPQTSTSGGPAALASVLGPDGKLDGAAFYKNFILPHEGGLNAADMNGSPSMYGFNQKANMDINVKRLTPDTATARYVSKYWPQSGSANLSPALAAIHADTSFINPTKAAQFLQQSNGDPAQYMALRRQWMAQMVQTNPRAAKYARAWDNRNNDLANLAGIGGASAAPSGAPAVPLAPAAGAPQGFNVTPGKTNQTLSPAEAQSLGLAPGIWQRDPTGKLTQASETPAGDLKRLDSLTSTADMLRGLVNEQTQFLTHNNNAATGLPFADINVAGHEIDNPLTGALARMNPDMQAMEGSHARQTFMVKPPASGRVMQSEIPYWAAQAQSPGNTGDVNTGILRDNAQRLATVTAEMKFYQDWLYQHGNSQGFEQAWANQQKQANGQGPGGPSAVPAHPQGITPEEAAKLSKGTPFITVDGRHMVRQ